MLTVQQYIFLRKPSHMLLSKFVFNGCGVELITLFLSGKLSSEYFFYDYFISDQDLSLFECFCRRKIFSGEPFFSTLPSVFLFRKLSNKLAGILYEVIYFCCLSSFQKLIISKQGCSEIPRNTFDFQTNYIPSGMQQNYLNFHWIPIASRN